MAEPLVRIEGLSLPLSGRRRARPRRRSTSRSPPGSSSCSPAAPVPGSRRCCARCAGWSRTTTVARWRARVEVAGLDAREHGPAELGGAVGLVAQDPETQVVSTTVRAELELPLEMRGGPPAARARSVEEAALALAIPHLLDRTTDIALRRRAPARRARRGAGPAAAPGAARRADLAARPGGGRRADLAAAAAERGVGDGRRPRRAPARAMPGAADRVIAMAAGADRLRRLPARRFSSGRSTPTPPCDARAPGSSTLAGLRAAARGREGGAGDPRAAASRRVRSTPARSRPRTVVAAAPWRTRSRAALALVTSGSSSTRDGRATSCAARPRRRARRAGRAHGPKRRREEHSAAGRGGAASSRSAGRPRRRAGCALLPQSPADMLLRERVGDELPGEAGARGARRGRARSCGDDADPRDLSGGERQRLALAIVMAGREEALPGLVCLDEPTRGMDRARKRELGAWLGELGEAGAAVRRRHPRRRVRRRVRRPRDPPCATAG